jgi:AraC-like DNA-binding protein
MVLRQSGSALLEEERLPSAVVSGLQARVRRVQHQANSSLVIVRFTEVGAASILKERVDRLFNQSPPLDTFFSKRQLEQIQNELADTPDVRQQIPLIEKFLSRQICERNPFSIQLENAVQMIRSSRGKASITTVARHSGMSQSSLERSFRAVVGASPKNLSRLVRLEHVCRLWDQGKSLTEIAFEAGYSDQPHLIRDFRLFTGSSPQQFLSDTAPRNLPIFYK